MKENLEILRALQRSSGLSPLAYTLRRALWDHTVWRTENASWLAVALWAHEYTTHKPTREEVAGAIGELEHLESEARGAA